MDNQHHWGWMVVVIIIVAVAAWIYSSNRPDVENYGRGSIHGGDMHRQDWPFSIHIGESGCQTIGQMQQAMKKLKENVDAKPTNPATNSIAK